MKNKNILRFFGSFFLITFLLSNTLIAATKAPIEGSLYVTENKIDLLKPIDLNLDFSVLMKFKSVGVTIYFPEGVKLLQGKRVQRINKIEVNKLNSVKYQISLTEDNEYSILVNVKVLDLSNAVFSRDFILVLNSHQAVDAPVFFEDKE